MSQLINQEEFPEDNNFIFIHENKVFTNSLYIAKIFNKKHRHVLDAIQNSLVDDEFSRANFSAGVYKDKNNQDRPMVLLSRDGFSLIAMGFTGKKAREFKINFINKFNLMEKELNSRLLPIPKTQAEILLESAQMLVNIEREQKLIKEDLSEVHTKINEMLEYREKGFNKLFQLEKSKVLPLQASERAMIKIRVEEYVKASGQSFKDVWDSLYLQFRARTNINVNLLAKNRNMSKLDYIESIGKLPELFAIASTVLVLDRDSE